MELKRRLDRFRGLVGMAGAVILSLQCHDGPIDRPPPPPMECANVPNPFDPFNAHGLFDYGQDGGPPNASLTFIRFDETGIGVAAVRVSGGTLISVEDLSYPGPRGDSEFRVTVAPDVATSSFTVEVDFTCGDATATRRFLVFCPTPHLPRDIITIEPL